MPSIERFDPTIEKLARMLARRARSLNEKLNRLQEMFLVQEKQEMFLGDTGCSTPFRTYHNQREAMVKAWHDYLGSLEAIPFDGVFLRAGYSLCLWDGERHTPANKDSYSHFIVPNLYLGAPYMLVPKELALKMLVLGSVP